MTTLAEVAAAAGVSKSTASRVLNGLAQDFRISAATVTLVEAAAQDLGYRPNYAAKALSSGRTHSVGVIGPMVDANRWGRDFYASIMAGINDQVRHAGFSLLFAQFNWHDMGLDAATSRQVESIIAPGFVMSPNFTELDLERLALPMVLVGDPPVASRHPIVTHDPSRGLEAAVDHLLDLGHRRIAWLGIEQDPLPYDHADQDRRATVRRRLVARGLELAAEIELARPDPQDVDRAPRIAAFATGLQRVHARIADCTAFLCYNDLVATAAIRALQAMGRQVPTDASVVGIDDLFADLVDPPLTSVDLQLIQVGRRAGVVAIEIAEDQANLERWRDQRDLTPSSLVVRGSTGPAPTV